MVRFVASYLDSHYLLSSCLWDAKHKRDACVLVLSLGNIIDTHEYIVTRILLHRRNIITDAEIDTCLRTRTIQRPARHCFKREKKSDKIYKIICM